MTKIKEAYNAMIQAIANYEKAIEDAYVRKAEKEAEEARLAAEKAAEEAARKERMAAEEAAYKAEEAAKEEIKRQANEDRENGQEKFIVAFLRNRGKKLLVAKTTVDSLEDAKNIVKYEHEYRKDHVHLFRTRNDEMVDLTNRRWKVFVRDLAMLSNAIKAETTFTMSFENYDICVYSNIFSQNDENYKALSQLEDNTIAAIDKY